MNIFTKYKLIICNEESGQSLVEYALVLSFVVVVCVGALNAFGKAVEKPLKDIVEKLGVASHP